MPNARASEPKSRVFLVVHGAVFEPGNSRNLRSLQLGANCLCLHMNLDPLKATFTSHFTDINGEAPGGQWTPPAPGAEALDKPEVWVRLQDW